MASNNHNDIEQKNFYSQLNIKDNNMNNNKYKILLIEDNPINIKVAQVILNDLGYNDIIVATTGQEALNHFSLSIDLILLDIGLPDMDGFEVCKKIRQILKGTYLPIIAWTAHGDDKKEESLSIGIDAFITKPVDTKEIEKMLTRWLPI
jgi:two-component system aerobic respiration control sensor histidine kinase ArcB